MILLDFVQLIIILWMQRTEISMWLEMNISH